MTAEKDRPPLLARRWPLDRGHPAKHGYKAIRCALCYRRLWPWQETTRGANYFPHPYMTVHLTCGLAEAAYRMSGGPCSPS